MSKGTDPQLAFDAVEEIRQLVGCPVIEAKGAGLMLFGGPGLNPKPGRNRVFGYHWGPPVHRCGGGESIERERKVR